MMGPLELMRLEEKKEIETAERTFEPLVGQVNYEELIAEMRL